MYFCSLQASFLRGSDKVTFIPTLYISYDTKIQYNQILISQRVGGFVKSEVTESDQELVSVHKQTINKKLGLKCNQYKVVAAWTQVVAGVNRFYNLLGDSKTECSANIYQSLLPCVLPQVTEAEKGWRDPTRNLKQEEEKNMVGDWRQGTVTEVDQKFLVAQAKKINEKLKSSFGEFKAVSVWTQIVSGVNRFYHVFGDMNTKISLNFYHPLNHGIDVQLTYAAYGWNKFYEENREGGWTSIKVTPEDSARLTAHIDEIDKIIGYNWKQFKPVRAWAQVTNGVELYYHTLTELMHPYSIKIHQSLDGTESVISAVFGWHPPN